MPDTIFFQMEKNERTNVFIQFLFVYYFHFCQMVNNFLNKGNVLNKHGLHGENRSLGLCASMEIEYQK